MKKSIEIAKWLAMAGALYLGFYDGKSWAANVFTFVTWITFTLQFFGFALTNARADIKNRGRQVPKWFSDFMSFAFSIALAAAGSFLLAVLWFLSMSITRAIHADTKEEDEAGEEERVVA